MNKIKSVITRNKHKQQNGSYFPPQGFKKHSNVFPGKHSKGRIYKKVII